MYKILALNTRSWGWLY